MIELGKKCALPPLPWERGRGEGTRTLRKNLNFSDAVFPVIAAQPSPRRTCASPHPQPLSQGRRGCPIRLIDFSPTLSRMSIGKDFITFGLAEAERALHDLMARDNLQLRPAKMPRTRRSRASGRLRQIEQIVRRLIFLMALKLHIVLAPPKARAKKESAPLPEGVELAIFPGAATHSFTLMPQKQAPYLSGPFPDSLRTMSGPSGGVPTAKLLARIVAVFRVMKAPDGYARRLARNIRKIRAKDEPRPYVSPAESAFRLSPELGALATALPGLLNEALAETWNDSG